MDRVETTKLVALIEAMCPAQRIADDTPAVWAGLLADVALVDALVAVKELGMRQEFIAPKDVITEVRRVRKQRTAGIDEFLYLIDERIPDVRAATIAKREAIARIANGESFEAVFGKQAPVVQRRVDMTALRMRRPDDLPPVPGERD